MAITKDIEEMDAKDKSKQTKLAVEEPAPKAKVACTDCDGTGLVGDNLCATCEGSGTV